MTTKIQTEILIVEIENRPALWDNSLQEFTDRNLKKRLWEEIVDILNGDEVVTDEHEKDALVEELQRKWKNIRGCYTRELGRKRALKTGEPTVSALSRKSEYKYFNQLQFLNSVVVTNARETIEFLDCCSEDDVSRSESPKPKRSKSNNEDPFVIGSLPIENREKRKTIDEDEDRMFLLSLVSKLKKVPERKKLATQIKILSILDDATQETHDYKVEFKDFCAE